MTLENHFHKIFYSLQGPIDNAIVEIKKLEGLISQEVISPVIEELDRFKSREENLKLGDAAFSKGNYEMAFRHYVFAKSEGAIKGIVDYMDKNATVLDKNRDLYGKMKKFISIPRITGDF